MNKQDLIEAIAKRAAISKKTAARALDAMLSIVVTPSKKKPRSATKRAKPSASKPRTGAAIKAKVARFKPGKALKDSVK